MERLCIATNLPVSDRLLLFPRLEPVPQYTAPFRVEEERRFALRSEHDAAYGFSEAATRSCDGFIPLR